MFKSAGRDFDPARATWHVGVQGLVYRGGSGDGSAQESEGYDGFGVAAGLGEQFGFELVRDRHFAGGDFFVAGADEAELAATELIAIADADWWTEDAAGHGTPGINVAAASGGIEGGTGRFVGELFEFFLVGGGRAEEACLAIAREGRAVLVEPGLGATGEFGGQRGVGGADGVHTGAEAGGVEDVDGEGAVAALRTADAAGEPWAGTAGDIGKRSVDDLHEFGVARGEGHELSASSLSLRVPMPGVSAF